MNRLFISLFLLVFTSFSAWGQSFVIKDLDQSAQLIGRYYEFKQPVKDINKAYQAYKNKDHTQLISRDKIKRSYSKQAIWYAFTVKNSLGKQLERIIQYPFGCTDQMELYVFDDKGQYQKITRLQKQPLKEREFTMRRLSAKLDFAPKETKLIIAKLKSYHQLSANFDIYSINKAQAYENNYKLLSLVYCGVVFSLFFYNFFIGVNSKEKSLFAYIGTLFLLLF